MSLFKKKSYSSTIIFACIVSESIFLLSSLGSCLPTPISCRYEQTAPLTSRPGFVFRYHITGASSDSVLIKPYFFETVCLHKVKIGSDTLPEKLPRSKTNVPHNYIDKTHFYSSYGEDVPDMLDSSKIRISMLSLEMGLGAVRMYVPVSRRVAHSHCRR